MAVLVFFEPKEGVNVQKKVPGYSYLLITVILFSTYEVVSKTLVGKIDPFQINFIRFLTGGAILFLLLLLKGDLKIGRKDFYGVIMLGIINVALSMSLLQVSLYIPGSKASVAAVIFSSNPVFVTVFSSVFEKEKLAPYKITGLFIGLAGIGIIFSEKLDMGGGNLLSPLLALLSALFYGLYTVIGRRVSVRIGSLKMNAYSFVLGSLCLLPVMLFYKVPLFTFDYSGIGQVAYLSVFVTGVAYLAYFKGLTLVSASSGSLVFFIKPILASLIAILFLREAATVNLFAGTCLVAAGIVVVVFWPQIRVKIVEKLQEFRNE